MFSLRHLEKHEISFLALLSCLLMTILLKHGIEAASVCFHRISRLSLISVCLNITAYRSVNGSGTPQSVAITIVRLAGQKLRVKYTLRVAILASKYGKFMGENFRIITNERFVIILEYLKSLKVTIGIQHCRPTCLQGVLSHSILFMKNSHSVSGK